MAGVGLCAVGIHPHPSPSNEREPDPSPAGMLDGDGWARI